MCGHAELRGSQRAVLFRGDGAIIDLVDLTMVVPLLFGLFWGAPLLAKEFEEGTHNLAWTQGVSRWRWIRANIGWSLLAAAVWGAALAALVSWWRYPENALASRFDAFDVQGIVPVAYALFAVALGIAVGSVIRRVLPSLAVTLVIFVAIRVAIGVYLRPHYMAPVTKVFPLLGLRRRPQRRLDVVAGFGRPDRAGRSGRASTSRSSPRPVRPRHHPAARASSSQCLASHGFRQMLTYQPASRFWAFQGIEAAIFVVLAAALVGFAIWWVLGRDA